MTNLIKKFLDIFAKESCKRPIIGYEFGIDTGTVKPVCCRKTTYSFCESKIVMEQIMELLKKIDGCGYAWDRVVV